MNTQQMDMMTWGRLHGAGPFTVAWQAEEARRKHMAELEAQLDALERGETTTPRPAPRVAPRPAAPKEERLTLPSGRVVTGDLSAFERHFAHLKRAETAGREVAVVRHELRGLPAPLPAQRASGSTGGAPAGTLTGYAAVFNSDSERLSDGGGGAFIERIAPGAFGGALTNDVRALANHDSNMVLGRTKAGTLRLAEDAKGLRFDVTLPNTQAARDVLELVRRGDMSQCSFGFVIGAERWETRRDAGKPVDVRVITSIKRLYDVSVVTYPAYPETTVTARAATKK